MIPIAYPKWTAEIGDTLQEVGKSGYWTQGKYTLLAEQALAQHAGTEHCVLVANGTIALEAILKTWGINQDWTIATTPFTFIATRRAIEHTGATPIYGDISLDTYNLDPTTIDTPVDAFLPVDLYGLPAQNYNNLPTPVFRDSAQAVGSKYDNNTLASSYSFYATKTVHAGEGGAILTNSDVFADKLRNYRNQGQHQQYQYVTDDGYNWRITEFQSAIIYHQLATLDETIARRKDNAQFYNNLLSDYIVTPIIYDNHCFHQYTLRHEKRDEIIVSLTKVGVEAKTYYPQLVSPKETWEQTPNALEAARTVFSIPVRETLTLEERYYIGDTLKRILGQLE